VFPGWQEKKEGTSDEGERECEPCLGRALRRGGDAQAKKGSVEKQDEGWSEGECWVKRGRLE